MTDKRFEIYDEENGYVRDNKTGKSYSACGGGDGFPFVIDEYHKLQNENERLKSEINMLKITIGRNEGYIDRLTHKGEWK